MVGSCSHTWGQLVPHARPPHTHAAAVAGALPVPLSPQRPRGAELSAPPPHRQQPAALQEAHTAPLARVTWEPTDVAIVSVGDGRPAAGVRARGGEGAGCGYGPRVQLWPQLMPHWGAVSTGSALLQCGLMWCSPLRACGPCRPCWCGGRGRSFTAHPAAPTPTPVGHTTRQKTTASARAGVGAAGCALGLHPANGTGSVAASSLDTWWCGAQRPALSCVAGRLPCQWRASGQCGWRRWPWAAAWCGHAPA
jgi:hypothetical protein